MEKESLSQMRARLLAAFRCTKCGGTAARAKTVSMAGGGLLKAVFSGNANKFLCITCERCCFTEPYETELTCGSSLKNLSGNWITCTVGVDGTKCSAFSLRTRAASCTW